MRVYTIKLLNGRDEVEAEIAASLADDDAAIDHAGDLPHSGAILVLEGDRLVARFPPSGRGSRAS